MFLVFEQFFFSVYMIKSKWINVEYVPDVSKYSTLYIFFSL